MEKVKEVEEILGIKTSMVLINNMKLSFYIIPLIVDHRHKAPTLLRVRKLKEAELGEIYFQSGFKQRE